MIDVLLSAVSAKSFWVPVSISTITMFLAAVTYTPSEIALWAAAATALVSAIGAAIVNIIMALRRTGDEIEKTRKTSEETLAEAKVISGHVNSAATNSQAIIDSQEKQLAMLSATIAAMEKAAALLAQSAATAQVLAAAGPGRQGTPPDVNTEETARNTATTDAAVKDLKETTKG